MRRMYSKGQIKNIGKAHTHLVQIVNYLTYIQGGADKFVEIDDIPDGLYISFDKVSAKICALQINGTAKYIVYADGTATVDVGSKLISDSILD